MKKERTDELFAMRSSTERLKILFFFLLVLTSSGSCYRPPPFFFLFRGNRGTKDNFHRQSLTPTR